MDNRLENLLKNKNCYFIHYASDGFYNGLSPAPRISCISIFKDHMQTRVNFSIDKFYPSHSIEDAEKMLLYDFKSFIEFKNNISFIHWNMGADGFGFKAIWARAKELGIELPEIQKENLFDLSSYVAYISEKRLSIKQILWFNSLLDRQYLDGKDEALYFCQHKFKEISDSVSLKVVGLSYVADAIKDGTLKTEKVFAVPNDGLTKEERRARALKIEAAREEMLRDMVNHNKLVLQKRQKALDEYLDRAEDYEPEYREEHSLFFFDFEHPLVSLFANWFANR